SELARHGYPRAHLDASVAADQVTDEAIIRLTYTPGPRCTFGPITLAGVDGELRDAAYARLFAHPGERYSSDDLDDSRVALYDMQRFSMVRIEPDLRGDTTAIPVTITVDLSTRHELRLGGGVGMNPTSYELRTRGGYSITGFPGVLEAVR